MEELVEGFFELIFISKHPIRNLFIAVFVIVSGLYIFGYFSEYEKSPV